MSLNHHGIANAPGGTIPRTYLARLKPLVFGPAAFFFGPSRDEQVVKG